MDVFTLDVKGISLAVIMAILMLFFGGWQYGMLFVAVMVLFLVLSAAVTGFGKQYKKRARLYQQTRGVRNVIANGLGPLLFAFSVYLLHYTYGTYYVPLIVGFIASAAAVTADKFSSEIGVLNGTPISIVTFKKIKKGMSGGISLLGSFAGLVGAVIISLFGVALLISHMVWNCSLGGCGYAVIGYYLFIFAAAGMGGFIGTVVDSYLGYFEEIGIGNKYTSNFFCSVVGGLVSIAIVML
jgi:uncharacterized protein (TIGR00297 family)